MNQRKLNEKLNAARKWCNYCEGAVCFVHEPITGHFVVTKKEPENWLYKVSYQDGEIKTEEPNQKKTEPDAEISKHIKIKTPKEKSKSE